MKEYTETKLLEKARELGYECLEYYGNGEIYDISDVLNEECTNDKLYILHNDGSAQEIENGYLVNPDQNQIQFYKDRDEAFKEI